MEKEDAMALIGLLVSVRDFVQDERDNRAEAGSYMSDYENEAERALTDVIAALDIVRGYFQPGQPLSANPA